MTDVSVHARTYMHGHLRFSGNFSDKYAMKQNLENILFGAYQTLHNKRHDLHVRYLFISLMPINLCCCDNRLEQ